jgi:methylase of polypeptide subunit release factors
MTPRGTSEQLVAAARAHVGAGLARVVDVGTDRGAIAIAVASSCPHAEIEAVFSHGDGLELDRRSRPHLWLRGRRNGATP